ncbi:MAG: protein kinase [Chthoniobacterales bacterium]
MFSTILSTNNPSFPTFQGSQPEARALVKNLGKELHYIASASSTPSPSALLSTGLRGFALLTGASDPRRLAIKEAVDSYGERNITFKLTSQTPDCYQQEATAAYLKSVIEVAYPNLENSNSCVGMVKDDFLSYLTVKKDLMSLQDIIGYCKAFHSAELYDEPVEMPACLESLGQEPKKIEGTAEEFLSSFNITFGAILGEGGFGTVYEVIVTGDNHEGGYVYKKENKPQSFSAKSGLSAAPFWRHGDCAASRLQLPGVAKTYFLILSIKRPGRSESEAEELYYVPAQKSKSFGMDLPEGTSVKIVGGFMERAHGKELYELRKDGTNCSPGTKYFNNIAKGLFSTLREAWRHNLIHGDIKSENIIYDELDDKVTLIDFGSAQRLRKREKIVDRLHSHQLTTEKPHGTIDYVAPSILEKKEHGSEVDFFSYGMLLLDLVSREDFRQFLGERFGLDELDPLNCKVDCLRGFPAEHYLSTYLGAISKNMPRRSSSQSYPKDRTNTGKVFLKHPEIKEIINLSFRVSAGGDAGRAAFEQMCQLSYFQKDRKNNKEDNLDAERDDREYTVGQKAVGGLGESKGNEVHREPNGDAGGDDPNLGTIFELDERDSG